jgi:hypothetical protein
MFKVEILIAGEWTMVVAHASAFLAHLIQTDLEYRNGDIARVAWA